MLTLPSINIIKQGVPALLFVFNFCKFNLKLTAVVSLFLNKGFNSKIYYLYCYFLEEITISLNYCLICLYKRSLFLFYYRIFNTFWKKTCFFWIQVVWFPLFKFQHSREICKQCFRSILCQQILINWGKKLIKQNNTSSFVLNVTSLLYKVKCILAR